MPNWSEVLKEVQESQQKYPKKNPFDRARRSYLKKVSDLI